MEKIKEMIGAEAGDEGFFTEMRSLANNENGKPDVEAIIKLAAKRGYNITADDINAYVEWEQGTIPEEARVEARAQSELTEEQLAHVAGGIGKKRKTSHRCFLITGAWTSDKWAVHCLRFLCHYPEWGEDGKNPVIVYCKCHGTTECTSDGRHRLFVCDSTGKCQYQDGFQSGTGPPPGSCP